MANCPDQQSIARSKPEVFRFHSGKRAEILLPEAILLLFGGGYERQMSMAVLWRRTARATGPSVVNRSTAGYANPHLSKVNSAIGSSEPGIKSDTTCFWNRKNERNWK